MSEGEAQSATYAELARKSYQTLLAALEWNAQQTFQIARAAVRTVVQPVKGTTMEELARESLERTRHLVELAIDDAEARGHEFAKLVDVATRNAIAWQDATRQTLKDLALRARDQFVE